MLIIYYFLLLTLEFINNTSKTKLFLSEFCSLFQSQIFWKKLIKIYKRIFDKLFQVFINNFEYETCFN